MRIKSIFPKIFIQLVALLPFFSSCKQTDWQEHKSFLSEYLENRYEGDFEIISIQRPSAPGSKGTSFNATCRSNTYPRKPFVAFYTVEGKTKKVTQDNYPAHLLEEAALSLINKALNTGTPIAFELEESFLKKNDAIKQIRSIEEAKPILNTIGDSSWKIYFYMVIKDYEHQIENTERLVADQLKKFNQILPARITAEIYIYDDPTLSKKDVQPDMNIGIIKRTPHKEKVKALWKISWNPSMIKNSSSFQDIVKNRENLPI